MQSEFDTQIYSLIDDDDLQKHAWAITYLAQFLRTGIKPPDYDEVTNDEAGEVDD